VTRSGHRQGLSGDDAGVSLEMILRFGAALLAFVSGSREASASVLDRIDALADSVGLLTD